LSFSFLPFFFLSSLSLYHYSLSLSLYLSLSLSLTHTHTHTNSTFSIYHFLYLSQKALPITNIIRLTHSFYYCLFLHQFHFLTSPLSLSQVQSVAFRRTPKFCLAECCFSKCRCTTQISPNFSRQVFVQLQTQQCCTCRLADSDRSHK
jgi:hypothetical protein